MADGESRVARVVPDVTGVDKQFDYLVPPALLGTVGVGSVVRVPLGARRVRGWVVDLVAPHDAAVDADRLAPVVAVAGFGPLPEVVALTEWAAWRWAGRRRPLLVAASAPTLVKRLSGPVRTGSSLSPAPHDLAVPGSGVVVIRRPPTADPLGDVLAAAALGPTLVVAPTLTQARQVVGGVKRAGRTAALYPAEWAAARAGVDVVVGARTAAWASVPGLAAVVVIDEHDESLHEERTPTWNARDVAVERATRLGVPCRLLSPVPSLDTLAAGTPVARVARTEERAGWPLVDIVDQGDEVPWRRSLISAHLTDLLRSGRRVVCVHNVPGRNRLVACRSCAALWRCERCDAALGQPARDTLRCARCGTERPVVCQACGATAPVDLRPGVERLHDDLAALTGKPVVVVAGPPTDDPVPDADVYVGTEAVLHRVRAADVVAFLDLDAELLAPRYRAGEQVLALLVRAARLVGGRDGGGRLVVQTSLPRHDVLAAVLLADPGRYAAAELRRRRELGFPPVGALASVGGEGAAAFVAALGTLTRLRVLGPHDGRYLVQAPTWKALADGLAAVPRPAARVRVEVDPPRV